MLKFITKVEAKKHSSSIIEVLVPDEIWAHLKQHVPNANKLEDPPHITLCYLPDLDKEGKAKVEDLLKEFCKNRAPVQIDITGSGCFPSDTAKFVHYAKVSSPDLVSLRDDLVACIQEIDPNLVDLEEFPNFIPHITVQYSKDDEFLPIIKPISWVSKRIFLSFKGTEKVGYPLSLLSDMQGLKEESVTESKEASSLDIITINNLSRLASDISKRLASFGYKEESLRVLKAAEVLGAKKKKPAVKDKSIDRFKGKLQDQLKLYVPYHNMDKATSSILNLLMSDNDDSALDMVEETTSDDSVGDGGGDGGGGAEGSCPCEGEIEEGDSVEALGPHMEAVDVHIMGPTATRMKGIQSIVDPTANKATPFMERNYAAELRTWLRRHT